VISDQAVGDRLWSSQAIALRQVFDAGGSSCIKLEGNLGLIKALPISSAFPRERAPSLLEALTTGRGTTRRPRYSRAEVGVAAAQRLAARHYRRLR